jgi:ABC-type bacteriocin/lantibiotic exporter with double-glycine peptidase domain
MKTPVALVARLARTAFRLEPGLWFAACTGLAAAAIEIAALTSLVPLSALALGQPVADTDVWGRLFAMLGWPAEFRAFAVLFLGLLGLRLVGQLVSQSLVLRLGRRLLAHLASRAFEAVMRHAPIAEIERRSIGWFITLAGDESFRASTIVIGLMQLVTTGVLAALYFGAIVWFSLPLAATVTVFLAASALALAGTFRRSRVLGQRQVEESRAAGSVFLDALNGLRTVRALAAESHVVDVYRERMFAYVRTLYEVDLLSLLARVVPALVLVIVGGVALLLLPRDTTVRDAPTLLTVLVLLMRFLPVTGQAVQQGLRLVTDLKAAQDVVGATAALDAAAGPSAGRIGPVHRIALRGIAFHHPAGADVFRDFDATFEAGRAYALVGPSGSGKSTLFDILLGLRAPSAGQVEIDGVAVDPATLAALRTRIVLVGQQSIVFNESLTDNIRFGAEMSDAQVDRALRAAALDAVVAALPAGRDTVLAYQGANLSGGQRQRIGLARALARDPDVLLLDEVTTGLDGPTRDRIVADVLQHFRDRLVIWATHDPEVIARLDAVVRVPEGERVAVPAPVAVAGRAGA